MKRTFITLTLVTFFCLILQSFVRILPETLVNQANIDSTYLISDGKVGKLEINMDAAKLCSIFPAEKMKVKKSSSGDDEYATYKIYGDNKKLAIEIESLCADICMVSRISVFSPQYKTLSGVGVGSSFAEVKKNFSMKYIIGGEGNNIMIYVKEFRDVAFLVRATDKTVQYGKPYDTSEILDTDFISQIYIF